jgi:diacylglycerol kinase (ATP)
MIECVVLVNPAAGRRPVSPAEIADALDRHGVAHTLEVVSGPNAMEAAVIEVVRSGRRLVLAGGDGTLGLAAQALVRTGLAADALPIGMLPVGTGCDFLRTFGIPQDLVGAAAHLLTDSEYRIDLGLLRGAWGERIFVNIAQAGVGAAAAETAPRLPRALGPARYPLAFAGRLPRFPSCTIEIETAARTLRSKALAVIMANGQFFAGGWNVAPKALLVDGELDVQVIDAKKRQAPGLVPKIIAGVHLRHPSVTRRSMSEFALRTEEIWPIEADGDYVGTTPVAVSVLPSALSIKI